MIKMVMAPAASALLRALIARGGVARDRILLTDVQSVDWRSLTFSGERHQLELRVPGPDAAAIVKRMCRGLADAEFSIPGVTVVDIAVPQRPRRAPDGSLSLAVEALTVSEG